MVVIKPQKSPRQLPQRAAKSKSPFNTLKPPPPVQCKPGPNQAGPEQEAQETLSKTCRSALARLENFGEQRFQKFARGANGYVNVCSKVFPDDVLEIVKQELLSYKLQAKNLSGSGVNTARGQCTFWEFEPMELGNMSSTYPELPVTKELVSVISHSFPNYRFAQMSLMCTEPGITRKKWKKPFLHQDFPLSESPFDKGEHEDLPLAFMVPLDGPVCLEFGSNTHKNYPPRPKTSKKAKPKWVTVRKNGLVVFAATQWHTTGNPFEAKQKTGELKHIDSTGKAVFHSTALKVTVHNWRLHIALAKDRGHLSLGMQEVDKEQRFKEAGFKQALEKAINNH